MNSVRTVVLSNFRNKILLLIAEMFKDSFIFSFTAHLSYDRIGMYMKSNMDDMFWYDLTILHLKC